MPAAASARTHLRLVESAPPDLVERKAELDVLGSAVEQVRSGQGGVVVLEASAGLGKTALLDHAARIAAEAGCAVRRAAPGPLEREFRYGVVRALLDGEVTRDDTVAAIARKVLWLCSALAFVRPLVLVVDDAQWADRQSLAVLDYVARRIAEVPVLLVLAARPGDPDSASDLLGLLATSSTVLEPAPLSPTGAITLIRRLVPDTTHRHCLELQRAAAGNPWLLGELATASDADEPSPEARRVVRRRMAALSARDRAVAEALAVARDDASPHVLAAAPRLPPRELPPARDALPAARLPH